MSQKCLFICMCFKDELLKADFLLSEGESCRAVFPEPYPKTLSQQDSTQGAAAELLSWQVFPSGKRIAGNQVATSFMVPRQYGF